VPHSGYRHFPGIGMLDRGFEDVGFCVVRGPDLIWGGDIRNFHPPAGRFAGVIGVGATLRVRMWPARHQPGYLCGVGVSYADDAAA